MKRIIWIGTIVALAGIGWLGHAAWRAHKQIVTLHVKNATVADVVRKMRWQTWATIAADTNLTQRVTLNLDNVPLSEALDELASQAGAVSGVCHAVYKESYRLGKLEQAMAAGQSECFGWTNLAPTMTPTMAMGMPTAMAMPMGTSTPSSLDDNSNAVTKTFNVGGGGNGPKVTIRTVGLGNVRLGNGGDDVTLNSEPSDLGQASNGASTVMVLTNLSKSEQSAIETAMQTAMQGALQSVFQGIAASNTSISLPAGASSGFQSAVQSAMQGALKHHSTQTSFMTTTDGNQSFVWPPERLMLEEWLVPKLGNEPNQEYSATSEDANALAHKVGAHAKTIYVLKKSPFGSWRRMHGHMGTPKILTARSLKGLTNAVPSSEDPFASMQKQMEREKLERYVKLTPEQRAENARLLRGSKPSTN